MLQPTIAQLPPEEANEPTDSDNTVANLSSPWEFDDTQPYCAHCAVEFSPLIGAITAVPVVQSFADAAQISAA